MLRVQGHTTTYMVIPLPHKSTLQRWCAKISLNEGVLNTSTEFMRQTSDLKPEDTICLLAFDEGSEYDPVGDMVQTPANYVQVVMARGIRSSWKQPLFYDFDCQMTKEILSTLICKLNSAGFPLVALVCDMGPSNRKLWRNLGVTTEHTTVNTATKQNTTRHRGQLYYIEDGYVYS